MKNYFVFGLILIMCLSVQCLFPESTLAIQRNLTATVSPIPVGGKITSTAYSTINCGVYNNITYSQCSEQQPVISSNTIDFTAWPDIGYVFSRWSDSTTTALNTKTYTTSFSISATFDPVLTISPIPTNGIITSNPPGIHCGTGDVINCQMPIPYGTAFTLTATPDTGYYTNNTLFGTPPLIFPVYTVPPVVVQTTNIPSMTQPKTASADFRSAAGVCGSANGTSSDIAPASGLCAFGAPSSVSGTGPWTWTCAGMNNAAPSPTCTVYKSIVLPRTGQNTCYSYDKASGAGAAGSCAGSGQDGELQKGGAWPSPRFSTNPNGTFTDNLTGLVWLNKFDCFNSMNWAAALSAANNLASGACGLSDGSTPGTWRLPNINELRSMVDIQYTSPALQLDHPYPARNLQPNLWSSTSALDARWAHYVDLQSGTEGTLSKSSTASIWLVKGTSTDLLKTGQTACYDASGSTSAALQSCTGTGQDGEIQAGAAWDNARFNSGNDGTVTDRITGLVWLKNAHCTETVGGIERSGLNNQSGKLAFNDALTWSNNLASGLCGLSDNSVAGDWRLPNLNELATLYNFSTTTLSGNQSWLTSAGFVNVQMSDYYGTSSTYLNASTPTNGWQVYLRDGTDGSRAKSIAQYVLPVRGGNTQVIRSTLTIDPIPTVGTITSNPAGINCGSDVGATACSATFTAGTSITLTATPVTGYGVDHITFGPYNITSFRDAPSLLSTFQMPGSSTIANATFYSDAGVCGSAHGKTFTVAPTSADGLCGYGPPNPAVSGTGPWSWTCTGWFAGSPPALCSTSASAPATYLLTISKAGSGSGTVTGTSISCGATCSASFTQGTSVTLTAIATSGTFTGWSGTGITCPGTGACTVAMNVATSVTATFTAAVTTAGTCGSAAGTPTSSAPSTNLCGANSVPAGAVSGYGPWTWTCNSTNGGTPSPTCTAPLATPQIYVQLPRTGQNTCYDAANAPLTACPGNSGQDGELQKGSVWPNPRFTVNMQPNTSTPDGTVTDNLTGLVWLQDYAACGSSQTWNNALASAASLASGTCGLADGSVAGNWRVPTITELNSLFDMQNYGSAFPTGHPFTNVYYAASFWSSTTANGITSPAKAWIVSYQTGAQSPSDKTSTNKSLLVRGGSINTLNSGQTLCYDAAGAPLATCPGGSGQDAEAVIAQNGVTWNSSRFKNNNNGTVTDEVTGLVWLRDGSCSGSYAFSDALAWSSSLADGSAAGIACSLSDGSVAGDWRLPNRSELMSLVNFGLTGYSDNSPNNATWLNSVGFANIHSGGVNQYYGTSSTHLSGSKNAWQVDLMYGTTGPRDKGTAQYVLPVRDGNFLSVNIAGTGSGSVNSTVLPAQSTTITCPGGICRTQYPRGSSIELTPSSSWYSQFLGWIGCDSVGGQNNNICSITMNESRVATAVFEELLTIGGYNNSTATPIGFDSRIQKAYDYLAANSLQNATIFTLVFDYFENLLFSSPLNVYIKGGWDGPGPTGAGWATPNYIGVSTVHGSLRITSGKLTVSNMKIR